MIFLDTSAVYALADAADPNHLRATALLRRLLEDREQILLHSHVLVEAPALLQSRLSLAAALRFLRESDWFQVHWVTHPEHAEGLDLLARENRRGLRFGRLRQLRGHAPARGRASVRV